MDENTPIAQAVSDSCGGSSHSAAATSVIQTYNYIFQKYRKEFEESLTYDESKDRKHQKDMRKLAREKQRQAEIDQIERDNAAKQNFEDFKERVKQKGIVTNFY
jgi:Skp family chaperone for outer membrane proteins